MHATDVVVLREAHQLAAQLVVDGVVFGVEVHDAVARVHGDIAGDPVVADVAQVGAFGTDGQELWVGIALAGVSADQVSDIGPVNLKIFTCAGPGTAP